jgi:hypothetical protein
VFEYYREASIIRRSWPTSGCGSMEKEKDLKFSWTLSDPCFLIYEKHLGYSIIIVYMLPCMIQSRLSGMSFLSLIAAQEGSLCGWLREYWLKDLERAVLRIPFVADQMERQCYVSRQVTQYQVQHLYTLYFMIITR